MLCPTPLRAFFLTAALLVSAAAQADQTAAKPIAIPENKVSFVDRASANVENAIEQALDLIGIRYKRGGSTPETGFDCSGLTMTSYRLNGLSLPRTARQQFAVGAPVGRRDLREADLVFFATGNGRTPSHVGLYIGDGRFVHAPGTGDVVRIDELSSGYYRRRFLSGRSYLEE